MSAPDYPESAGPTTVLGCDVPGHPTNYVHEHVTCECPTCHGPECGCPACVLALVIGWTHVPCEGACGHCGAGDDEPCEEGCPCDL